MSAQSRRGLWTPEEHDRFLQAMKMFPRGPWKAIADHIGTRSVRQAQTHAQKYHEKVARRMRGLRKWKIRLVRPEHRIDDETMQLGRMVNPVFSVEDYIDTIAPPLQSRLDVDTNQFLNSDPAINFSAIQEPLPFIGSNMFDNQNLVAPITSWDRFNPRLDFPATTGLSVDDHSGLFLTTDDLLTELFGPAFPSPTSPGVVVKTENTMIA